MITYVLSNAGLNNNYKSTPIDVLYGVDLRYNVLNSVY